MISPHRRRNRGGFFALIPLTLFTLALIASFFVPLPQFLAGSVHFIASPFLRIEHGVASALAPLGTYIHSKEQLRSEVEFLQSELEAAQRESLMAKYYQFENTELRRALGRDEGTGTAIIGAVLAGPARSPYDTLVIDAGENRGVTEGALVTTTGGYAIGTVSHVYAKSAVATLFSSPSASTRVMIGTSSPHSIRAEGRGGGSITIMLPREVAIAEGDPIVLPGIPTIPIGEVGSVIAEGTSAYQAVRFSFPVNIFEIRYVIIGASPAVPHAYEWEAPFAATPAPELTPPSSDAAGAFE